VRSFWVGLGLATITLTIYYYFWYYLLNDELKDIGIAKDDPKLAGSTPALSLFAVLIGWIVFIPPLVSVYKFCWRIERAEHLGGIDRAQTIKPVVAFLLYFPGGLLFFPTFIHYWYVTKHQNAAVRAAGAPPA
jgi:hypothetical protein